MSIVLGFFFFFSSRRRHTRLQGDWSSDVCSSDLAPPAGAPQRPALQEVSSFILLEREVEIEYRPRLLEALQGKVHAVADSLRDQTPSCGQCGQPMKRQDTERSEEHTSELQSPCNLVCRLLLEKKKT